MSFPADTVFMSPLPQVITMQPHSEVWWQSNFISGLAGAILGGLLALLSQKLATDSDHKRRVLYSTKFLLHCLARRMALIERASLFLRSHPFVGRQVLQPLVQIEAQSTGIDEALAQMPTIRLASDMREWMSICSSATLAADAAFASLEAARRDSSLTTPFEDEVRGVADALSEQLPRARELMNQLVESYADLAGQFGLAARLRFLWANRSRLGLIGGLQFLFSKPVRRPSES